MAADFRLPDEIDGAWELGPTLLVSVADEDEEVEFERRVRISVTRPVQSGGFWASYEEEAHVRIEGKWLAVWASLGLPPVSGATATECLQNALEVVAQSVRRVDG